MTIQQYLKLHSKIVDLNVIMGDTRLRMTKQLKRIVCTDGFSMSVQVGENLYCTPRINLKDASKYKAVEIGFPNRKELLLLDWAEDPLSPTDTVYGYVPVSVVNEVIKKHGGFKVKRSLRKIIL